MKDAVYVNCALLVKPKEVFACIFRLLVQGQKCSISRGYEALQTYLRKLTNKHATKPLVIIDEVDFLVKKQDMEVIYNLLELRGLKLVMCANSINFIGELGQDRVGSRMSAFKRINLPDYEAEDYR